MSYADQQMSATRVRAFIIVALIHIVVGYFLVTGLAYSGARNIMKHLTTVNIEKDKPKPPPPPPPPKNLPPPPGTAPVQQIHVAEQPVAAPEPATGPVPQNRPSLPQSASAGHVPAATPATTDLIAKTIKTTTPKTTTRAAPTATAAPQDSNAPLQLTPVEPAASANPPPVKIASAQPAPAAPSATATGDGFAVQLGVAGSEEDAKALSAKMTSQFGSVLGSYRPSVRKSDVNGKTVYRVRVVNLAKDDAVALCEKLRGSGGQCFIAH